MNAVYAQRSVPEIFISLCMEDSKNVSIQNVKTCWEMKAVYTPNTGICHHFLQI